MTDFVSADSAPIYPASDSEDAFASLLWGDPVEPTADPPANGRTRVRARGWTGWVDDARLGGEALLELYFIDVGQGDSVLVVTPDRKHFLIDGGYRRDKQPMGKNGSDFVDWKFHEDGRSDTVTLDAVFLSHCDADHYGGLHDLFDPDQRAGGATPELDVDDVRVDRLYHSGIAWWRPGGRWLGPRERAADGTWLHVQLLGDRTSVEHAIQTGIPKADRLQGEYADFWRNAAALTDRNGNPTPVDRLAVDDPIPASVIGNHVTMTVLGPHPMVSTDGNVGLADLGSDSVTANGQSLVLALQYVHTRVLLTGDLNAASMRRLLDDLAGRHDELRADVAKACHHGSHDVSADFLAAVGAACTIISSGDSEGHGHPRPSAVAAAAVTGHRTNDGDRLVTPLIYSTEIARSVRIGRPTRLDVAHDATGGAPLTVGAGSLRDVEVTYTETKAGDLHPTTKQRSLANAALVVGTIYGLVNVRTDGTRILCATRNEKDHGWEIETFTSRFAPPT